VATLAAVIALHRAILVLGLGLGLRLRLRLRASLRIVV
jgi:hypothetical protein